MALLGGCCHDGYCACAAGAIASVPCFLVGLLWLHLLLTFHLSFFRWVVAIRPRNISKVSVLNFIPVLAALPFARPQHLAALSTAKHRQTSPEVSAWSHRQLNTLLYAPILFVPPEKLRAFSPVVRAEWAALCHVTLQRGLGARWTGSALGLRKPIGTTSKRQTTLIAPLPRLLLQHHGQPNGTGQVAGEGHTAASSSDPEDAIDDESFQCLHCHLPQPVCPNRGRTS